MNCLADLKILKNTSWHLIKWYFLAELHSIQPEDTLDLANKLKGKQIDHMRSNMDVRLAAQTLSSPVIVKKGFLYFSRDIKKSLSFLTSKKRHFSYYSMQLLESLILVPED